jgi:Ni/Fe-hydrogenase subunit HybB-like protein
LGAFGAVLTAHIGVELLELDASFHQSLAIVGIPLAWMTGAYTGWLFKQAKGRTIWASRSNFEISAIATLEMMAFALVPYSLVSYAFDKAEIQTPLALVAAALLLTFVYFAFKHINKGLQKAQMEPLL